jgi:hypothetical protein
MSDKGKEREPLLGREGLLWSDVYEHLGLAGQTWSVRRPAGRVTVARG